MIWPILVGLAAASDAQQFRRLQVADGRTLYARIIGQTPEGLELELAQGTAIVTYDEIAGMTPVEPEAFAAAPAWSVVVLGNGELAERLARHFDFLPNTELVTVDKLMSSDVAARCGEALDCLAREMPAGEWAWFVSVAESGPGVVIEARVSEASPARRHALLATDDASLWATAHDVLGLRASPAPPPVTLAPPPPPPVVVVVPPANAFAQRNASDWTEKRVDSAAFIPIPGFVAGRLGDPGHAAVAWVTAVPAVIGFAYVTGAATDDAAEGAVIGSLGSLAIVTAINQITGRRALARNQE